MFLTPEMQRALLGRTADAIERARETQDDARETLHAARNTRHYAALLRELSRRGRTLRGAKGS